jgi:hypothetical protein
MTLFTHLPFPVIAFLLFFAGTLALYNTFKVPKEGKFLLSSMVFGGYGLAVPFLMLEYNPSISFEKMFAIILLIWVVWFISGLFISIFLKNRRY